MKRFSDVSIDIETLDTVDTAAILSIGAVAFDFNGDHLGPEFYETIDIESCLIHGRSISGNTLRWWLRQDRYARAVFEETEPSSLPGALGRLTEYLHKYIAHDARYWANSPNFDLNILNSSYKACNKVSPIAYYNMRDLRTLKWLVWGDEQPPSFLSPEGTAHNAVDDARNQARVVQVAFVDLRTLIAPTKNQ